MATTELQNGTAMPLNQGEWVVNVNNHFYWSHVYLFSLVIKCGQWVLHKCNPRKYPDWQYNHAVRFVNGRVVEMLANGKNTHETVEHWLTKQRRTLKLYRNIEPFKNTLNLPYDFFGLPQKMLSYFRKEVLKKGNTWNGTDGVLRDGYDCIEEVYTSIREHNPHIALPCMVPHSNKLVYVATIETYKN